MASSSSAEMGIAPRASSSAPISPAVSLACIIARAKISGRRPSLSRASTSAPASRRSCVR